MASSRSFGYQPFYLPNGILASRLWHIFFRKSWIKLTLMKKITGVFLAALFAMNVIPANAQKPAVVTDDDSGWQKIGETTASFQPRNESMVVLGADEFMALKIKVENAALQIERLQVFYESGEMEELKVPNTIQAGEESEVFNLEKPDRDIQKVAFTYRTVSNSDGDKAEVLLYGLKPGKEETSEAYREDGEKTENKAEKAVEKTGAAIMEGAGKVGAEIEDKRHQTKVGPDFQPIYIDNEARTYYIDSAGKRVYVSEWQLRDKP